MLELRLRLKLRLSKMSELHRDLQPQAVELFRTKRICEKLRRSKMLELRLRLKLRLSKMLELHRGLQPLARVVGD